MSLMSKLLISVVTATTLLSAEAFNVKAFVKENIVKNPDAKVKSVEILSTKTIPNSADWKAYLIITSNHILMN